MDIDEVKKFIQNKIDTDNLTQKVRDVIKTKKWEKQDLKEGFKESFKPLIKAQTDISETIKKENAETIEQLEKNQLALTQGLLANRLALTQGLQAMGELMGPPPPEDEFEDARPESPQPGPSQPGPSQPGPSQPGPSQPAPSTARPPKMAGPFIDLEAQLDQDDIDYLQNSEFIRPNDFLRTEPNVLNEKLKVTNKEIQSLNGQITGLNKKKNKTIDDMTKLETKKKQKKALQHYKAVLSTYINSLKYQKGKGIYFQNPHQLVNRLELLVGSILAGNNGVIPEFSQLAHFLNKTNIITKKQLNDLLKSYIKIK